MRFSTENACFSCSSWAKALTTRTPEMFSCVLVERTAFCSRTSLKATWILEWNFSAMTATIGAMSTMTSARRQLMKKSRMSEPKNQMAFSQIWTTPPASRLRMPSMSPVMRDMISPM